MRAREEAVTDMHLSARGVRMQHQGNIQRVVWFDG